jgi:hypothetical protein
VHVCARRPEAYKRLTRFRDPDGGAYARVDEPAIGVAIEPAALPKTRVELRAVFTD